MFCSVKKVGANANQFFNIVTKNFKGLLTKIDSLNSILVSEFSFINLKS